MDYPHRGVGVWAVLLHQTELPGLVARRQNDGIEFVQGNIFSASEIVHGRFGEAAPPQVWGCGARIEHLHKNVGDRNE